MNLLTILRNRNRVAAEVGTSVRRRPCHGPRPIEYNVSRPTRLGNQLIEVFGKLAIPKD